MLHTPTIQSSRAHLSLPRRVFPPGAKQLANTMPGALVCTAARRLTLSSCYFRAVKERRYASISHHVNVSCLLNDLNRFRRNTCRKLLGTRGFLQSLSWMQLHDTNKWGTSHQLASLVSHVTIKVPCSIEGHNACYL